VGEQRIVTQRTLVPDDARGKIGGVRAFRRRLPWIALSVAGILTALVFAGLIAAVAFTQLGLGHSLCAGAFALAALTLAIDELMSIAPIRADDQGLRFWSWRGRVWLPWSSVGLVGYSGNELVLQGSPRGLRVRLNRLADRALFMERIRTSVRPGVIRLTEREERLLMRGKNPFLGERIVQRAKKAKRSSAATYRDTADARVPTVTFREIAPPRWVLWVVMAPLTLGVAFGAVSKDLPPVIGIAFVGAVVGCFVFGRVWARWQASRTMRHVIALFGPEVRPRSDGFESADGAWRHRRADLDEADRFFGGHAHWERIEPGTGETIESYRVPLDIVHASAPDPLARAFAMAERPVATRRFFEGKPAALGGRPTAIEKEIVALLLSEHKDGVVLHRFDRGRRSIGDTWHPDRAAAEAQAKAELGDALGTWRMVTQLQVPLAWWPAGA
jgi:hypothetical protein